MELNGPSKKKYVKDNMVGKEKARSEGVELLES